MANKVPIFARASTLEVLEYALNNESGILYDLDRICYVYMIDSGELCYVDAEKNIYPIIGANKPLVLKVDALPPADEADEEVLYIYNNIVYIWTGTEYRPSFYEVAIQLDNLTAQLNNLENRVLINENNIEDILSRLGVAEGNISQMANEIQNKANISDVYTKAQADVLLDQKADSDDVYGRNYIDNALSNKADANEVYSKDEMDTALNGKADKSNTYTKDEVDALTHVEISGEPITITEYVNMSTEEAVQDAHDYTDQQLELRFV